MTNGTSQMRRQRRCGTAQEGQRQELTRCVCSLVCVTAKSKQVFLHSPSSIVTTRRRLCVSLYFIIDVMHHAQARAIGVTRSKSFTGAWNVAATELNRSIVCSMHCVLFGLICLWNAGGQQVADGTSSHLRFRFDGRLSQRAF